jgi:hypothetical protein
MGFQSPGSPNFGNFGICNLEVLRKNDIWVQAPCTCTKNTIRRKVVASLSIDRGEPCEFVFARGESVHQKCPNYALTILLFGFCRSVWIIDSLVTCPSPHPKALACSSTSEVLRAMEHTPTPYPSIVFTLDS